MLLYMYTHNTSLKEFSNDERSSSLERILVRTVENLGMYLIVSDEIEKYTNDCRKNTSERRDIESR